MINSQLSHFRISTKLGEGGMGEVYRATDERLGREVAIKILPQALTADPERLARLEREARILASLAHPNIAGLHDIGEAGGVHFLVMELAEGQTLEERLRGGPLALDEALPLAVQIARALEAAHERGVVHRDLKPANVMISDQGRVKLLDFGLAKAIEGDPSISGQSLAHSPTMTARATAAGMILGTAAYMSPEQARGKLVDKRTDVWALGLLLYEMLTARRAFDGETFSDVLASVLRSDIEWGLLPASTPPALRTVLRRCTERDPDRRLHDVADVRIVLEETLSGGDATAPTPAVPAAKASRLQAAWIVAALAAGAIIGWAVPRLAGGATAPPAPAPVRTFRQLTLLHGGENSPAIAPDGESFLYVKAVDGQTDIFLQRIDGQNAINLTRDHAEGDVDPAFSPDGRRIAFRSQRAGGGIFVMGATGESVRKVTGEGQSPSWSPDGTRLVIADERAGVPWARNTDSRITSVVVETGERTLVTEQDGVQPVWSPDGRWIAFWGLPPNTTARDLFVVPADGSAPGADQALNLTADRFIDWNPVWSADGRWLYFSSSRGGTFNLWRLPIDPATGRRAGDPEPISVPSSWAGGLSLSADGRRLIYRDRNLRQKAWRARIDVAAAALAGAPVEIPLGSLELGDVPTPSPDGRSLVFATAGLPQHLFVLGADGEGLRQLSEGEHRDRQAEWSPDGEWIAFQTDRYPGSFMGLIRADGSGLRPLGAPQFSAWYPVWSPDGKRLAFSSPQGSHVLDPWAADPARTMETLPRPGPGLNFWPSGFSPDGRRLVGEVFRGAESEAVAIYTFAGQTFQTMAPHKGPRGARFLADGRHITDQTELSIVVLDLAARAASPLIQAAPGATIYGHALSARGDWITWLENRDESDIWLVTFEE